MFWWEGLQRQFHSFDRWFYNWKTEKPLFIAKTAVPNVWKALTARNLLLIGGLTRKPGWCLMSVADKI